jgi:hypothetical protein
MPLPTAIERHLTGDFKSGCIPSMFENLGSTCFVICCAQCAIARQRRQILEITGEPYVCCGGTWPCCGFEKPKGKGCLFLEACLFPHLALAGNRFLVQTRLNKRNDWMDNVCQIGNLCVACEFFILRLCCTCSDERENLVKSAACICACTHCQNAGAIHEINSGQIRYQGPPAGVVSELPQHFTNIGRVPAVAPVQMKPM